MRCFLVLGVVLAAVGGALALGSSSTPAGQRTTLVKQEKLAGGAVKRVWSNGATFVGDADAAVTFTENAAGEATGASVAVPGPASLEAAARMARAYGRAGRSTSKDMVAAGISREPAVARRPAPLGARNYGTANTIYDSGCLTLDNSDAYWHGCFTRKGTVSSDCCAYYLADASQALGNAKLGGHWLVYGYTEQRYASGNTIVQWSPGSDITSSSGCTASTVGLSEYGATLSRTYYRCPKQIDVTKTTAKFRAAWVGCKGSSTSPGVAEAAFTKVPVGNSTTLYYGIGYQTIPLPC